MKPFFLCEVFFSHVKSFYRSLSLKEVTIIYRWNRKLNLEFPRFGCLIWRFSFLDFFFGNLSPLLRKFTNKRIYIYFLFSFDFYWKICFFCLGNLSVREYLFLILFWFQFENLILFARLNFLVFQILRCVNLWNACHMFNVYNLSLVGPEFCWTKGSHVQTLIYW